MSSINPANWTKYQTVTNNSGLTSTDATTLVITEDNLASGFFDNTSFSDGRDVRACENDDGTGRLACHILAFNKTARTCIIYVYIPSGVTSLTSVTLFTGNASASAVSNTDTFGRNATRADYEHFWNLDDDYVDSTGRNNLTSTGSVSFVSGVVGKALDIQTQAANASASITPSFSGGDDLEFGAWVQYDTSTPTSYQNVLSVADSTEAFNNFSFGVRRSSTAGRLFIGAYSRQSSSGADDLVVQLNGLSQGDWVYIKAVLGSGNTTLKAYSGSSLTTGTTTRTIPSGTSQNVVALGAVLDSSPFNDGQVTVDLPSIKTANLSDDTTLLEYNNALNPSTFWSSGSLQDTTTAAASISPQGIASDEAFGSPSLVLGSVTLGATAIPSEEVFGSPSLLAGASSVQPSAIPTGEALGSPNIDVGAVLLEPVSIVSEELFGTPQVTIALTAIAPTGIISAEAFGACLVKNLVSLISLSGIPTEEVFGRVTVLGGDRIIIPIDDRQTWNRVANYLRGLSFKGSDNDVIIQWLRSEGYEGQYNDAFNSYLEIGQCYQGTLTDKYAKWKRGETPTGCWLLEGGIWNDNGIWIDTEFWED